MMFKGITLVIKAFFFYLSRAWTKFVDGLERLIDKSTTARLKFSDARIQRTKASALAAAKKYQAKAQAQTTIQNARSRKWQAFGGAMKSVGLTISKFFSALRREITKSVVMAWRSFRRWRKTTKTGKTFLEKVSSVVGMVLMFICFCLILWGGIKKHDYLTLIAVYLFFISLRVAKKQAWQISWKQVVMPAMSFMYFGVVAIFWFTRR